MASDQASFKDGDGNEFTIRLTVGLIDAIRDEHQLNVLADANADEGDALQLTQLLLDPSRCADVLWTCIRRQADALNVERGDFRGGLGGEQIADGIHALRDAIVFFTRSQSPAQAEALEAVYQAEWEMLDRGAEKIRDLMNSGKTKSVTDAALAKMDEQFNKATQGALDKIQEL